MSNRRPSLFILSGMVNHLKVSASPGSYKGLESKWTFEVIRHLM